MVKVKGKRTDFDVDTEGIVSDNRKTAGFMTRLFRKFSAIGIVGAILITVISAIMLALGFVPCIVTLIIGMILIVASFVSYTTFDEISKEL